MSENQSEPTTGIDDEQLPEDLRPSEENPLAQPLDEDVDTEELDMDGGKGAEQDDDDQGDDGQDDGGQTDDGQTDDGDPED